MGAVGASGAVAGDAGGVRGAAVLELAGVVRRFGRRGPTVLDGVDLRVAAGEAVALGGRNGAGKTTLLRLCAGVARASAGQVARPAGAGAVGWAPDRFEDAPRLTARELLRALAVPAGEAAALADALGLAPWLDRPLGAASKGTRHKAVLAQALAGAPRLIVLDEPWADLDAAARDALAALLDARRAAGAAILLSEHGRGPLRCDRRLELRDGRLVAAAGGEAPGAIRVRGPAAEVAALAAEARARGLEVQER